MSTAVPVGGQPLAEVAAALGSTSPTPAAGSAVAACLSLAAGLVVKCARKADGRVREAAPLAERAEGWQRRVLELADEDAERYEAVVRARRGAGGEGTAFGEAGATPARGGAAALAEAADPPLEIAALGAEVAAAAALLARHGKPALRGDAHAAALLAEAGVGAAAALARLNLTAAGVRDARLDRVGDLVAAAEDARAAAEAALGDMVEAVGQGRS